MELEKFIRLWMVEFQIFVQFCPSNFVRLTSWQISVITYSKQWPLMNLIEDGSFSFAKEIEGFVSHLVMAILM